MGQDPALPLRSREDQVGGCLGRREDAGGQGRPGDPGPGTEIQWALDEVVGVAATTEAIAEEALRAVKVEYEVLPHFVNEADLSKAPQVDAGAEEVVGDPDGAMATAEVKIKGTYGMPPVAHNCMEAHGQICEWTGPDTLNAWCSTQAVAGLAGQFAEGLGIPAANVHVMAEHIGGGYGSKFGVDRWGIECAKLAKLAGAAGEADAGPPCRDHRGGRPAVGLRRDRGRGEEGRHAGRLELEVVGLGRPRRCRQPAHSLYLPGSQPAS